MLRPAPKAGFTLIELMIVICLIGVMAAAAYPSLNAAVAQARVANAAARLVRLGAQSRALATYTGLAHVIAWYVDGDGDEKVAVFRGTSARCNSTNWGTLDDATAMDARDMAIDAGEMRFSAGMRLRVVPTNAAAANAQICMQPNGTTMLRQGNAVVFTPTLGALADILFDVFAERGGTRVGPLRQVVFPYGNLPRWVQ